MRVPKAVAVQVGRYRVRLERPNEDMFVEKTGARLLELEALWPRGVPEKLARATLKYAAGFRKHTPPWFDLSEAQLRYIIRNAASTASATATRWWS